MKGTTFGLNYSKLRVPARSSTSGRSVESHLRSIDSRVDWRKSLMSVRTWRVQPGVRSSMAGGIHIRKNVSDSSMKDFGFF